MSAGRAIGIVIASLVALAGLGLLLGGGGVLIAERVLSDDGGFVVLRPATIEAAGSAFVAPAEISGAGRFLLRNAVTLRVFVSSRHRDGTPIFVGLAERSDTARYLQGSSYAEAHRLRWDAGSDRLEVREVAGSLVPAAPATETIWLTSATGSRIQSLTWRIEPGDYALVVMNADGSPGVAASVTLAVRAPIVRTIAGAALGTGVVLLLLGLAAVFLAARRSSAGAAAPTADAKPMEAPPTQYPLTLLAEPPGTPSPVLWLVKWLLLVPHFVALGFLWIGFGFSWFVSLVAIVCTGRYPRGLFDYNVGVLRWTWRVGYYGYLALATDEYPPFTLRAGGYPADLEIPYPEKLSRGRALVKWWLLAIPHYLVVGLLLGGMTLHYGGLILAFAVFAGFALLFTGTYPKELFHLALGANRWVFRVAAYAALLTDAYPPFRFEE